MLFGSRESAALKSESAASRSPLRYRKVPRAFKACAMYAVLFWTALSSSCSAAS